VGKDTWEGSLKVTRRKGKVVYCGSASGQIPAFDLGRLTSKNLSVCKPGLRQWIEKREELEYYGSLALRLVQNGELKLKKHKFYHITEAAQAHLDLENRKTSGKCYIKL
jgi:NADPH2:quinone reductase